MDRQKSHATRTRSARETRAIFACQCVFLLAQRAKKCDTNHISWATAYSSAIAELKFVRFFTLFFLAIWLAVSDCAGASRAAGDVLQRNAGPGRAGGEEAPEDGSAAGRSSGCGPTAAPAAGGTGDLEKALVICS